MKLIYFILLSMLFMGCYPARHLPGPDESMLIEIECRNEIQVRQFVMQQLKLAKARDVSVEKNGGSLYIKAAYLFSDTPEYKVLSIAQDIREMSGVLNVEVRYNRSVVREIL